MMKSSNNYFSNHAGGSIPRFEKMVKQNASYYFDVEELEDITDHYLDRFNERMALRAIEYGLELFPKNTALLLKKAQVLVMRREPRMALKILDHILAMEPTNTDLLLFKSVIHRNLNDHESSKECLMQALEWTPDNKEEIYLDLAYEQELAHDYDGAINSLKASLEINPEFEPTLFEIGFCYEMKNDLEGGVEFFQEYIDEYPYNHIAWYNLAMLFDKLGLQEKAIESVDYALAIAEDFTGGHILKAHLHLVLEQGEKAIEAFREGLVHDPENPMLYTSLAECQESLGLLAEAEENYRKALELDPDFIDAIMGLGAIREAAGDLRTALSYYLEAYNKDIFNSDNQHVLAETHLQLGEYQDAEKHYSELLDSDYTDEDAWIGMVEVLEGQGENAQALATAEEGMEKLGNTTDLKWHHIKLLILNRRLVEAESSFHDAALVDPDGIKYFLTIFRDVLYFPNIAALIELHTQAQGENEL